MTQSQIPTSGGDRVGMGREPEGLAPLNMEYCSCYRPMQGNKWVFNKITTRRPFLRRVHGDKRRARSESAIRSLTFTGSKPLDNYE